MSPTTYMCENCKTILCDYRGKPHDPLTCPLLDIAYCGICSKRGHFHVDCPDTLVQRFRKPQYLEELIPPSLKEKYKIHTTRTPLADTETVSPIIPISMWDTKKQVLMAPPFYPNIPPSMWEFPKNNAEYVKKFLVEHKATLDKLGLKIKEKKEKNEEVLLKLAEHMNKIVVWTTKSAKHTEKHEVPAQPQPKEPQQQPKEPASKKRSHKKKQAA